MQTPESTNSPFQKREPIRIGFRTMLILLLMVVTAGVGLLIYYALKVPAITGELNAWLGRPEADATVAEAREAQLIFALFLYSAPLGLGMFVYGLHYVINWLDRFTASEEGGEADEFRME